MKRRITLWPDEDARQKQLSKFLANTSWEVQLEECNGTGVFFNCGVFIETDPSEEKHVIRFHNPEVESLANLTLSLKVATLAEKVHPAFSIPERIVFKSTEIVDIDLITLAMIEFLCPVVTTSIYYIAGELVAEEQPDIWEEYLELNMKILEEVDFLKSSPTWGDAIMFSSIVASVRKHLDPTYYYPNPEVAEMLLQAYKGHQQLNKDNLLFHLLSLMTRLGEIFGIKFCFVRANGTYLWVAEAEDELIDKLEEYRDGRLSL